MSKSARLRSVTTTPASRSFCDMCRRRTSLIESARREPQRVTAVRGGDAWGSLMAREQGWETRLIARGSILEQALELVEEAARGRRILARRGLLEFLEQLALALGEVLRGLHVELHVEIAHVARAQDRHALALEPHPLAGLRAGGDLHAGARIVEDGDLELAAERGGRHGDGDARIKVGAVALEEVVRLDRHEDVEIARRSAAQPRFALVGE